MKRRILSVLLTLCMVASLLPFEIFAAEDAACVTGLSITVDGVTYTEGNVRIKPDSTVVYNVTGTNLHLPTDDYSLEHAKGIISVISSGSNWIADETHTTASRDYSDRINQFISCENFRVSYILESGERVYTDIYLTYDDGSTEADKAEITGISLIVDGVTYTEGHVSVKPESEVIFVVHGKYLRKADENLILETPGVYVYVERMTLETNERCSQTAIGTWFEGGVGYPITYTNDAWATTIDSGITVTCENEFDDTPAEITGLAITVDGVTYTEGNVIIRPESTVSFTVTGLNLRNVDQSQIIDTPLAYLPLHCIPLQEDGTYLYTTYASVFEGAKRYQITYTNDSWANSIATDIFVTYKDHDCEDSEWIIERAATCAENGSKYTECLICHERIKQEEIPATGEHSWDEGTVTKAPTCTETGVRSFICTVCSGSRTEEILELGHSYSAVVTAPTCEDDGYTTYTCHCGDTYVADQVDALGHNHTVTVTAPTCADGGYTTYTCHCGDTYVADQVDALGHSHTATVTAPTCADGGYTTYTCHCGDTYVADEVDALGHSYVDGVCTVCGGSDPNYVPPADVGTPTEPSEPTGPNDETEHLTSTNENFFIAFINAIIAFFKRLFGIL